MPAEGIKIELYLGERSTKTYLGSLVTDQDGQGSLFLSEKFYMLADTLLSYNFVASLTDSPDYMETVTELDIVDASIEVNGLVQGTQRVVQAIVRDITDRRRAEEKVKHYQNQLRALVSQLTLSEERERKNLAVELHDSICQSLAMTKLKSTSNFINLPIPRLRSA